VDAVSIELREKRSPAFNTLVCVTFKNGTPCERDRVALDARPLLRLMAEDVHVTETGLRRPVVLSFSVDPVAFSKLAVQTTTGHDQSLFCSRKINAINKDATQHIER
jgi:hypothetical protein